MRNHLRTLRKYTNELYNGRSSRSRIWRFSLLCFDLITIGYFILSATVLLDTHFYWVDYAIGLVLLLDYVARLSIAPRPKAFFLKWTMLADLLVILSLFSSAFIENLGFLRVIRMLRLLRSHHILRELREASSWFRRNEEIIGSALNLAVFIFTVTAVVFVLENDINPNITTYMDALYFTVTTLTTTGYGDITLSDTTGRTVTIAIMIFGVALFLRLIQAIFRPAKVKYGCQTCGLSRHDPDAVHCKHCGETIRIPTEGDWK
ncbi:ion transporter [Flexibacterium corallicola]|uniref:ion transporter n=1 Tax=Flexibacterium corallicola TaxID=3037259 RepID=UPI00286F8903|nr:ion transporter [Pseudovibrio sp. M1P-2-3]